MSFAHYRNDVLLIVSTRQLKQTFLQTFPANRRKLHVGEKVESLDFSIQKHYRTFRVFARTYSIPRHHFAPIQWHALPYFRNRR